MSAPEGGATAVAQRAGRGESRAPARRAFGRALAEMHVQLRTEGESAAATAAAVGLGTFIGCLPLYGAHLLLCVTFARLFRISRIKTYLAAHLNNPLTAPLLLYAELAIGHLALERRWPNLRLGEITAAGALNWGRDLAVGGILLGALLGVLFAGIAVRVQRRWAALPFAGRLREETARRYLDAGIRHWEFVRGKLRWDPVYWVLLRQGDLPPEGRLLDLGCGCGIALALIDTARRAGRPSPLPAGWRPPSEDLDLVGIEARPEQAAVARTALGDRARIVEADLAGCELPLARTVLLIDVLHYLPAAEQEALLRRAAAALEPGGVLHLREADAALGLRFALTRAGERISALFRGRWRQRFHYRSAAEWRALLAAAGLETTAPVPAWQGTPFGNQLVAARRPSR